MSKERDSLARVENVAENALEQTSRRLGWVARDEKKKKNTLHAEVRSMTFEVVTRKIMHNFQVGYDEDFEV